jgi:hypothetical protein
MKKIIFIAVLMGLGFCVFGCQEDQKKTVQAAMWCKADTQSVSMTAKQLVLREEIRFLENEQLYYGMEAERSRTAQTRSQSKLYSIRSPAAGTIQNSY